MCAADPNYEARTTGAQAPQPEVCEHTDGSPAGRNAELNEMEYKSRATILESYPTYVALNLSDVCNACCAFCRYNFYKPHGRMVTLVDIQRQEWLKYLRTVTLFCGLGESLVNPEFKSIFRYMRNSFPYQGLCLTTNGILVDEEVIGLLLDGAASVQFSVNAFRATTYQDLMRHDKRDTVFQAIAALCAGRTERNSATPSITLSYVAVRQNVRELPDFVDHFGALGVDDIVVLNYNTTDKDITVSRRLSPDENLHNHKELAHSAFERASQAADKHPNLTLTLPGQQGLRGPFPGGGYAFDGSVCPNPWSTVYIDTFEGGRWLQFCCTFLTDHSRLTAFDFERPFEDVWNGDFMQWIRQGSLPESRHPSCEFCMSHDLSNPDNNVMRKQASLAGQTQYDEYAGTNNVFGEGL